MTKRTLTFDVQFLTIFETAIRGTYTDHYAEWGNAKVMVAKLMWDFASYWAVAALPFMQGKYLDLDFAKAVGGDVRRMLAAGARVEQLFRDWNALGAQGEWRNVFIRNRAFPGLYQLHLDLDGDFDDESLRRKYAENADLLDAIAVVIFHSALEDVPGAEVDAEAKIDPAAIGLDPGRWEKDKLLKESGLSLTEAQARTEGIEKMLLTKQMQAV